MTIRAFICSIIVASFTVLLIFQHTNFDKYIIIPASLLSLILCLYGVEKEGRNKMAIAGVVLSLFSIQIGLLLLIFRSELF
ncbi:MAG: hypothetical protein Q8903_12470 [Bacteroidota bacterium]|nr:hypothetical protein [Bacteroidota bacterium]